MEFSFLRKFGITPTEAKIFLELAKLNEAKIGLLIKKTSLHRGTVYNSLNDLVSKGFVSFIDKDDSRFYKLSGESIFLNLISEKNKEVVREKEDIKKLFDEIEKSKKMDKNQKAELLYGIEAFKSAFLGIYDFCKKQKMEYLFMGAGGKMSDAVGLGYYRHTQKLKKQMKIKCRVILSKESKNKSYHQYTAGNIRYLPTKVNSPANIWIYGDNILFVVWESNPLVCIKIESNELANSFKNHFEGLWSLSESDLILFESRHKINLNEFIEKAENSIDIMDICCMEPLHEGRAKIIKLLNQNKKVRILIADPKSPNFEKRVRLEEQFIRNLNESRILFELNSAIANIKDIVKRTNTGKNIEVRMFRGPSSYTIINLDDKFVLFNKYSQKKGEYGASKSAMIVDKCKKEFLKARDIFESYWKRAETVSL